MFSFPLVFIWFCQTLYCELWSKLVPIWWVNLHEKHNHVFCYMNYYALLFTFYKAVCYSLHLSDIAFFLCHKTMADFWPAAIFHLLHFWLLVPTRLSVYNWLETKKKIHLGLENELLVMVALFSFSFSLIAHCWDWPIIYIINYFRDPNMLQDKLLVLCEEMMSFTSCLQNWLIGTSK